VNAIKQSVQGVLTAYNSSSSTTLSKSSDTDDAEQTVDMMVTHDKSDTANINERPKVHHIVTLLSCAHYRIVYVMCIIEQSPIKCVILTTFVCLLLLYYIFIDKNCYRTCST
jgi:hypothetical protein